MLSFARCVINNSPLEERQEIVDESNLSFIFRTTKQNAGPTTTAPEKRFGLRFLLVLKTRRISILRSIAVQSWLLRCRFSDVITE